ncbi:MAG: AMP-binding protein [Xanthomonadaceae bacterium]|nr:AMP-binding protein [Xanthomonadaceae bacterium]MDE1964494.1 AMP-binding protein [Xanthomonadaceae bacterium]
MRSILRRISEHAIARPRQTALQDEQIALTYDELVQEVALAVEAIGGRRVALWMDNSCAWAVVDLALARQGCVAVPVPPFFSTGQVEHLFADARPDVVVTTLPDQVGALLGRRPARRLSIAGRLLSVFELPVDAAPAVPHGTAKITYTSGTTGQPKGVCLSARAIGRVAQALGDAVQGHPGDRALSLLPLSTLLENIGGLYVALAAGGTACVPSLASCGFEGSSAVQAERFVAALNGYAPSATVLVPQLLKLLVESVAAGAPVPHSLRMLAVGGAPCAPHLIERAWQLGLPVHEGYGLSESASVVSLNPAGAHRAGSVGRVLPHVQVTIAGDGEILVAGNLFEGYLGSGAPPPSPWPTGDLGRLDDDGYLYLTGRKKTAYATAFGRNVAPEWVESELIASGGILQAAVFGEGRPHNVALLVPHPAAMPTHLDAAVARANAALPDYARIAAWHVLDAPFTPANGLARPSGSLAREAIASHHAPLLEALYASQVRPESA